MLTAQQAGSPVDPVDRVLAELRRAPWLQDRIEHEIFLPSVEARTEDWPFALHPSLVATMRARGIVRPYSHQAEAIAAATAGRDVVVVTPTASGKSLCYIMPVLDAWLRDPEARSLWLFPTKALAQDQLSTLQEIAGGLPGTLRAATYDGDTPSGLRQAVRQAGHIVVTNPDMLHNGVLPHHTAWVRLFQQLRYIVIDEVHTYRGVFGSHLANVLRRLRRLCAFYGGSPVFIACSATIANPKELTEKLIERTVHCVAENGAPRAGRRLWLCNPPLVDRTLNVRRSGLLEARRIVGKLVDHKLQTIAFARSRHSVEVLLTYLQRLHPAGQPGRSGPIRGYRGGYLPLERRSIESGLRDGSVRAVVSTNALELGIDIGGFDAAVLVGYPGSVASTWQQLGRAGRRGTTSLGVFIATDSPIDQFLIRHPEYLIDQPAEEGLINPDNLLVLGGHVQAAAFELAFERGERFGTADVGMLLECFAEDGLMHRSGTRFHWSSDAFPAEAISLRRATATNVVIIDTSASTEGPGQGPQGPWAGTGGGRPGSRGRVIGEVDQFSAPVLVHDDAIYLHEGRQYHVERLDWEEKRAYVHPIDVDHYTMAETRQSVVVLERYAGPTGEGCTHSLGEIRVSRLATLYKKVRFLTHENVGAGPIALPEQDIHTTAYWLQFDLSAVDGIPHAEREAGLWGLTTALHQAACLLCMCDPRDLGTHTELRGGAAPATAGARHASLDRPSHPEPVEFAAGFRPASGRSTTHVAGPPTIYLFDTVPGGVGFAERCNERHRELCRAARRLVEECPCSGGCPSCVGPGSGAVDARVATLRLLDVMWGGG